MAIAPVAIFPIALVFVAARALMASDPRELLMSPISAIAITFVGYPIAMFVIWLIGRIWPRALNAGTVPLLGLGVVSAEACFWGLIHPFWQRDFSNLFCAAMVATCGLVTAMTFQQLRRRL